MAVTLTAAGESVTDVMEAVLAERFPALVKAALTFEVLMATSDDDGPAVKHAGAPALAKIKKIPPEQKVGREDFPDLRILIDAGRYHGMSPRRKEALFAHELFHVVLVPDPEGPEGSLKEDRYGRPMIRLKPDDWSITGFKRVHEWYGNDSCEQLSFNTLREVLGQQTFDFMQAGAAEADVDEPETRPFPGAGRKRGRPEDQATA